MAVYLITGKLGTGKGKTAVRIMQRYLREGRQVVTNMDINLHALTKLTSKKTITRIPDKPCIQDLHSIGHGNPDTYDEDRNGGLFLDELATWLNSRSYQEKGRQEIVDFLVHTRKLGWDLYLTCQSFNGIDRQAREMVVQYVIQCVRFDRHKIPMVGWLLNMLHEKWGYLPRFHMAATHLCVEGSVSSGSIDKDFFKGDDLHDAYDTRQIFTSNYPHGVHTVLSAWHTKGRYMPNAIPWWKRLFIDPPKRTLPPNPALAPLWEIGDFDERWKAAKDIAYFQQYGGTKPRIKLQRKPLAASVVRASKEPALSVAPPGAWHNSFNHYRKLIKAA